MERKEINANYIELIDKFRSKLKSTTDLEDRKTLKLTIKQIKKNNYEYNEIDKNNKKSLGMMVLFGLGVSLLGIGIAMSNEGQTVFKEFLLHACNSLYTSIGTVAVVKEIFRYVARQNNNNEDAENFINECNAILDELEVVDEENENVRTR